MAIASAVRPADQYDEARLPWAVIVVGWSGPRKRSLSAVTCSPVAMASPVRPADWYDMARLAWAVRVPRWSGPRWAIETAAARLASSRAGRGEPAESRNTHVGLSIATSWAAPRLATASMPARAATWGTSSCHCGHVAGSPGSPG